MFILQTSHKSPSVQFLLLSMFPVYVLLTLPTALAGLRKGGGAHAHVLLDGEIKPYHPTRPTTVLYCERRNTSRAGRPRFPQKAPPVRQQAYR